MITRLDLAFLVLALLAVLAPLAVGTLYRIRRLEILIMNGITSRVARLERDVFGEDMD